MPSISKCYNQVLTFFGNNILKPPSTRAVNFFAASLCLFLLLSAAFLQYELNLKPCPLCMIQRLIFLILGVLFLLGGLISFKQAAHKLYYISILLITFMGVMVAGRHIWLESLPVGQVEECGPTLGYIFKILPPDEAFKFLFAGTGHCGAVTWQFLDLSIPHWTLVFFGILALLAGWQAIRKI